MTLWIIFVAPMWMNVSGIRQSFSGTFFSLKKLGHTEFQNALTGPHAPRNLASWLILILADTLAQVMLPVSGNICVMVAFSNQFKTFFNSSKTCFIRVSEWVSEWVSDIQTDRERRKTERQTERQTERLKLDWTLYCDAFKAFNGK